MGNVYIENVISCGSLVVDLVGFALSGAQMGRAIASQSEEADVGCMGSAPIAADKVWYHRASAMQDSDLVGRGRRDCDDCV